MLRKFQLDPFGSYTFDITKPIATALATQPSFYVIVIKKECFYHFGYLHKFWLKLVIYTLYHIFTNKCKLFFWQFENSLIMRSIYLDNLVFPTSLCVNTNAETGSHFIAVGCRAGNLIFMDFRRYCQERLVKCLLVLQVI